jgi:predicted XRE-type DNA-binding protein
MAKRDPERTQRLRNTIRYLLEKDGMAKGNQATLARHFHVSRQRVHQIVVEERQRFHRLVGQG